MEKEKIAKIKKELAVKIGEENVNNDPTELFAYGFEASLRYSPPSLVVRPRTTEDVKNIVNVARVYKIPLTPRGAGTSFAMQSLSLHDGILVDFRQMNKIKSINVGDQLVTCEPGVYYRELNKKLGKLGFTFPPEPGSSDYVTVGGMVGNNASGMHAVKYGATKSWVIDLEVVLANGKVMHTGSRSLKSSSGYCLNELFTGSEGTLGLITEITLKVGPKPKHFMTYMAALKEVNALGECAVEILKSGVIPSAMEFCDDISISFMKQAMKVEIPQAALEPGAAILFVEVDGPTEPGVKSEAAIIEKILKERAIEVSMASTAEEREDLWYARHAITTLFTQARKGRIMASQILDIGIPTSKIPTFLNDLKAFLALPENKTGTALYGHIGDGNIHFGYAVDPEQEREMEKAFRIRDKVSEMVLGLNGTLSAEHGTGFSRTVKLEDELGYKLEVMRWIKKALDPDNIMNPGPFFEVPVDDQGRPNEFIHTKPYVPGGSGD
ncbi:MAG: FAD-binding oxidoreductase [Candidatus Hodarchaeota archaeon]